MLGHPVPEHVEHPHGRCSAEDRLALAVEVLVTTRLAVLSGTGAVVAHDALRVVLRVGRTRGGGKRRRRGRRARPGNMDSKLTPVATVKLWCCQANACLRARMACVPTSRTHM